MQDGVVLPEKSNKRDEIENGTDGADEDLIPTFENQQENATTLLKVGADIEDIEPALMEKNVKNSNINIDPVSDDDEDDIANDALEVAVDFHEVEAYNQNPTTSSPPCQAIVLDDIEISDDDDSDDDDPELGQYVTTKIVAAIPKMKEVVEEEEEEEDFLNDAVDVATDEDEEIGSLQPALTEGEYEEGDCQTSGEDEDGEEILAVGVDLQEEDLIGNKDSDDDERDEAVEADEEKGENSRDEDESKKPTDAEDSNVVQEKEYDASALEDSGVEESENQQMKTTDGAEEGDDGNISLKEKLWQQDMLWNVDDDEENEEEDAEEGEEEAHDNEDGGEEEINEEEDEAGADTSDKSDEEDMEEEIDDEDKAEEERYNEEKEEERDHEDEEEKEKNAEDEEGSSNEADNSDEEDMEEVDSDQGKNIVEATNSESDDFRIYAASDQSDTNRTQPHDSGANRTQIVGEEKREVKKLTVLRKPIRRWSASESENDDESDEELEAKSLNEESQDSQEGGDINKMKMEGNIEDQVDENTSEGLSSLSNTSLDGKIDALITRKDSEGFGHCIKCGYARKNISNVRNHIESRHLNNSVLCPQCDMTSATRHALTMHFSRKHPDWEVIS